MPRGFRLKWTCHFDVDNEQIAAILENASKELVNTCAVLAGEKVSRLEQEYGSLLKSVKEIGGDSIRNIETVIEEDVKRSRETIAKVKHRKLAKLRNGRSDTGASYAPEDKAFTVKSKHCQVSDGSNGRSDTGASYAPEDKDFKVNSKQSTEGAKLPPVEIVNMSSRPLSEAELSVLKRGLSFVPTRRQTIAQLTAELKEWDRLMRLQEYWHGVEAQDSTHGDKKYKISKWVPPKGRDQWLDLYLEEVASSVIRETRRHGKSNLSSDEESALLRLIQDDTIVIRPADKGSGIVVMNSEYTGLPRSAGSGVG